MGDLIGRIFRLNSDLDSLSDEKQKAIRGWCYYDWAKSAFETSVEKSIEITKNPKMNIRKNEKVNQCCLYLRVLEEDYLEECD